MIPAPPGTARRKRDTGFTDAGYKGARSGRADAGPDNGGYQRCSGRLLIAKIAQLFLGTPKCVSRERERFTRIIGESSSEAVDCGIITSNQTIKT